MRNVGKRPAGLLVTLFINWLVKPFSMALMAWAFFRVVFAHFITSAEADQYIAGCIILAAAPCTAMVFVWSHLTKADAAYTLVQVSVNDLIMLVLIVQFLVHGASSLTVPFNVLLTSVLVFIVAPLLAGVLLHTLLLRRHGEVWFEGVYYRTPELCGAVLNSDRWPLPDEVAHGESCWMTGFNRGLSPVEALDKT